VTTALLAFVLTMGLLGGILAFTEALDRRQAMRMVRHVAHAPLPPETAEQLVAEDCDRLLRAQ